MINDIVMIVLIKGIYDGTRWLRGEGGIRTLLG
jgi:hypothetical protein